MSTQRDALRMLSVNVRGTAALYLAAAAAGIKRFVHLGTAFEYGPSSDVVDESSPLRPKGIYAAWKVWRRSRSENWARVATSLPLSLGSSTSLVLVTMRHASAGGNCCRRQRPGRRSR